MHSTDATYATQRMQRNYTQEWTPLLSLRFERLRQLRVSLANPGEGGNPAMTSFQSYTVANTATFLFEATCERDKNIPKTRNI